MPGGLPPAGTPAARRHVAGQLRVQARACAASGSPLYDLLLRRAADDVEAAGPCWTVLAPHVAPGRGGAVALRFMAALHRLVLTGRAPALAAHYPSAGGTARGERTWAAFRTVVADQAESVAELVGVPCQTNEVGRAAALVGGFLEVAAATRLPLRCLEVGASAGLNLRWDRFRYGGGGAAWGDPASTVDLDGLWRVPPPAVAVAVEVVERRGCDPAPVDPAGAEGRLALRTSVWADQPERLARLDGALALAQDVPARVDEAGAAAWVAERLAEPADGRVTVVYHSVVEEYLPDAERERFHAALARAARRATARAPLAWLRLEPASALRVHHLTLTLWPPGGQRLLARCRAHGTDVEWLEQPHPRPDRQDGTLQGP